MAGSEPPFFRAAFAELLDDHWKTFRDQLLEAIPENQAQALSPEGWPLEETMEDNSVGPESPTLSQRQLSPVPSSPESGSVRDGVVSQVPSLPKLPPNPQLHQMETAGSLDSTVHNSLTNGGGAGRRANVPYLNSSLHQLSPTEARAIRHRLRVRLGAMSKMKMVSGQSLHDAVQALGLTRYSVEEMNDLVNLLADFINLNFKEDEGARKKRRQTIFSWEEDNEGNYGEWTWDWPQIKEASGRVARAGSMATMSVMSEHQANSTYNLVPASALMELFLSQESDFHKRIFGIQGYKQFLAMREILLAGDTNRLVAELTFVRINDLAAPPEPTHPLMYVEPFVALFIVLNGVMIGFQTEPQYGAWEGWTIIESVFAGFLVLEILLRMHLLGCRNFWCGEDQLWNLFDVLLGITGVADVTVELVNQRRMQGNEIPTSLLRFCRLIRLVRIVKVFRLKFMKDLRLMVKGLVAGIRTLTLAFTLLLSVIYVISGFATYTIGRSREAAEMDLQIYFRNLPISMFTAFRCFTGECTNDLGYPMTSMLASEFGLPFVACYIISYMLVSMGIFNVILAVYVEITMKAAKENEATTAEQYARESIRVARTTRELLKKFAAAYRIFQDLDEREGGGRLSRIEFRSGSTIFTDDDVHDKIAITKELFLLVIQDRDVQRLMDELDLPPDRANLFEVIDADGSGTLHITELVQGLLQIRGEIKKSDTVAALLATKAVQSMVAEIKEGYEKHFEELKATVESELHNLRAMSSKSTPRQVVARVAHV